MNFKPNDANKKSEHFTHTERRSGITNPAWLYSFNTFVPPLYPLSLAVLFTIFGYHELTIIIFQSILGGLVPVLVGAIAYSGFNRRIALGAGAVATIYPGFIFLSNLLMTELYGMVIFLVSLFFFSLYFKFGRIWYLTICGVVFGMAVLTRAFLLPLVILYPAMLFLFHVKNNKNIKASFFRSLLFFVIVIFTIAPWTIRNYIVHREIIPVTSQLGIGFYSSYVFSDTEHTFGYITHDTTTAFANKIPTLKARDSYLIKKTVGFIAKHPKEILKLEFQKIILAFSPMDWEIIGINNPRGEYNIVYAMIIPLIIFGMFWALRNHKNPVSITISIFVIAYTVLMLVFYGSSRFRVVIDPLLIIFATAGFEYAFFSPLKKTFFGALFLWTLAQLFIAIHIIEVKHLARDLLTALSMWS